MRNNRLTLVATMRHGKCAKKGNCNGDGLGRIVKSSFLVWTKATS